MPDLSSAPRMDDPSVRMTPSATMGRMPVSEPAVHVRRHENGVDALARQHSGQVSNRVLRHLAAQLTESLGQLPADVPLMAGRTVDGNQIEERPDQPVRVDLISKSHQRPLSIGPIMHAPAPLRPIPGG